MNLNELRDGIDNIDNKILELLNQRMKFVHDVGELKNKSGGAIYRPEREKAIINRLTKLSLDNSGILDKKSISAIFYEIIGVSKNLERTEKVAYLGPIGTFTHQAAEQRFGTLKDYIPLGSISSVFKAVDSNRATYGVVPIENSSDGVVGETLDLLGEYNLNIVSEIYMPIHHSFASLSNSIQDIDKIYSKDKAFGQCREFLEEHGLSDVEQIPTESTSKAANLASNDPKSASICLHIAAKLNHLPILFDNIEDRHDNKTRFIIIGKFNNEKSGDDKTSILAKISNEAGSLVRFLEEFDKAGINLTKIESRPAKVNKAFMYWFYIDFEGHISDKKVIEIIDRHHEIKCLGSYVRSNDEV